MKQRRGTRVPGIIAAIVATLTVVTGCAPAPSAGAGGTDPRLAGDWRLVSAADAAGQFWNRLAPITLTITSGGPSQGRSGCGTYGARVTGGPGPVWVSVTPRALGQCDSPTTLARTVDARYFAALTAATMATVTTRPDGDRLLLAGGDGVLQFLRPVSSQLEERAGVAYRLGYILYGLDMSASIERTAGTLLFSPDGTLSGRTECTTLDGTWRDDAGEILTDITVTPWNQSCSRDAARRSAQVLSALTGGVTLDGGRSVLNVTNIRRGVILFLSTAPAL